MLKTNKGGIEIPVAILLAGVMIAVAVYFSIGRSNTPPENEIQNQEQQENKEVPSVQADDHILGNPEADIVIIEYSDMECPYCKEQHKSLQQVMDKYGADGSVAWVYRQLPLPQLHSKAIPEAQASECAASLGGNETFWTFTNKIYDNTTSNDGLDLAMLPQFAEEVGLDRTAFEACLDSDTGKDVIERHTNEAIASTGGRVGTPHNVILFGGEQITAPGYIQFEALDQMIAQMLAEQE